MTDRLSLHFTHRTAWRQWLEENHHIEKEVWLIHYKKHTGRERLPYNQSVEEALCFGWVDSLVNRLDEDRYAQKFTPRKPKSRWSESNKRRIQSLEARGLLEKAGRLAVQCAKESGRWDEVIVVPKGFTLPEELVQSLKGFPEAQRFFEELPPSAQKPFILWVATAKREETRKRRALEAVEILGRGERLGLR